MAVNHYANKQRYFISPNEVVQMRIPALSVLADFKYFSILDQFWQRKNGELKQEFDLLRGKHALNSLSIGLGLLLFFYPAVGLQPNKAFPDDHRVTTLYPTGYRVLSLQA